MLMILCIILFRICKSFHYAPKLMHYAHNKLKQKCKINYLFKILAVCKL